ncbi:hypothetical protein H5410_062366 [Solanum commersonii]|uniref:Uncharacterized protein n=1 Tax=Solanum commersonii TaxID=4109 RepID=A0A9J5WC35_SOLCO|nr:hypothetical protein H5410_062366 [Solanum commersonii]
MGRPWIHMARATLSTRIVVKFEHNHREIIMHGKMIYLFTRSSIPYIKAKEECDSIVYRLREPRHLRRDTNKAREMEMRLRTTKGLTDKAERCHTPFPIFIIPLSSLVIHKRELPLFMKTSRSYSDLGRLFCEVNMVQVGEGTSHADVHLGLCLS